MPEFSTTPQLKGAGLYGGEGKSHVTACVNSKNPAGHNPECQKCFRKKSKLEVWKEKKAKEKAAVEQLQAAWDRMRGYGV